jgi:hypothetical protein
MAQPYADVETLRRFITDEVFNAIGLPASARLRDALRPLFAAPTRRFVRLLAEFDKVVALHGPAEAARGLIPRFADHVEVHGAENIPSQGGLLVASNHPGAIDGILIAASLQRKDLKVIASGIPFLKSLPATAQHLIYTTSDPHGRMNAARASIRHLQSGGTLLVYPSGLVDPDPAVYPGAQEALGSWSRSLELFLQNAPETQVLVTIVRGMLSPGWARSPLTWLRRPGWQRRKLAEFFQVMEQMLIPGRTRLRPCLQFAPPLQFLPGSNPMPAILECAASLLEVDLTPSGFPT